MICAQWWVMPRSRAPSPKKKRCEREFPVRLRVKVPPEGFGKQLDEMFSWLDREIGRGNYEQNSDTQVGQDATSFYFLSAGDALKFEKEFNIALCDLR